VKFDLFVQRTSNLFAVNRLLMVIVVLIGGLTLFNSFMLQLALNRQAVVLVPAGLKDKVSLTAGTIDEGYAREMARYLVNLLLVYSPGTVRKQFEEVLTIIDPEAARVSNVTRELGTGNRLVREAQAPLVRGCIHGDQKARA